MRRIIGTIGTLVAAMGLLTACGSDDEQYCTELPEYFRAMGESMQGDTEDPDRFDAWAAKAEEMAGLAPEELQDHWDFVVDYSARMSEAGGDPSALEEGDVKRNGEAGTAITQDAQERCDSGS